MGMFDYLKCEYKLPANFEWASGLEYQTKDTPMQLMDHYLIKEDGTLWHESYDTEDHSNYAKWKREHPGETPPDSLNTMEDRLFGCITRVNLRWEQLKFSGELRFYTTLEWKGDQMVDGRADHSGWLEFSAYFVEGKVNILQLISFKAPNAEPAGPPVHPEQTG